MPPTASAVVDTAAPLRPPLLVIVAGWLLPGSGHLLLGRRGRAAIIFCAVALAFAFGVAMQGPFFAPAPNGDILSKLIQYGGIVGDVANGLFYFAATFVGYGPPDGPGHAADYGSKLIVCGGLLNVLGIVDAYEIATRKKD
jgi:hypothetical protein